MGSRRQRTACCPIPLLLVPSPTDAHLPVSTSSSVHQRQNESTGGAVVGEVRISQFDMTNADTAFLPSVASGGTHWPPSQAWSHVAAKACTVRHRQVQQRRVRGTFFARSIAASERAIFSAVAFHILGSLPPMPEPSEVLLLQILRTPLTMRIAMVPDQCCPAAAARRDPARGHPLT